MSIIDGISYSQRKAIAISHTNVGSSLSNFPLCVQISGDADIGGVCRPDGADLRFADADGNLLYAQKESFSVLSGAAAGLFWVRVPSISASADTTIYCYYGNQQANAQSGSSSVWDANFQGVWHLDEASAPFFDSSGCGNNGSNTTNLPTPVTGLLGGAQLFGRSSVNYIAVGDSPSLGTTTYLSLSAWLKLSTLPPINRYYEIVAKGANYANYGFRVHSVGYGEVYYASAEPALYVCATSGIVFSDTSTWYYVCGVYDGSFLRFYVNGVQAASLAATAAPVAQAAPLTIGNRNTSNTTYGLDGALRSAEWIRFEYYNQKDHAGQLTWGPQQAVAAARSPIDGSLASSGPLFGALA
jgi:MSHA biogenesis protein MshQ